MFGPQNYWLLGFIFHLFHCLVFDPDEEDAFTAQDGYKLFVGSLPAVGRSCFGHQEYAQDCTSEELHAVFSTYGVAGDSDFKT